MKIIDIEKLLIWAYREELPKLEHRQLLGVSNFELVSNYAEEMCETVSDGRSIGNRYWQLYGDGPHPDAVAVDKAVKALAETTPVLHEEPAMLLSDMPAEVQAEAETALQRYHVEIVPLVIRCASMGQRPEWRTDVPKRVAWKPVGSTGGAPLFTRVEIKGAFGQVHFEEHRVSIDKKTRRGPPGSYHKMVWQPEPWAAIDGRADWLVWMAALDALTESLSGALKEHEPTPATLFDCPWEHDREDTQESPRVLPSVSMRAAEGPERALRTRLLRPHAVPKAGPVRHVVKDGQAVGA